MRKLFTKINAEDWSVISAMLSDKRLDPKDMLILKLYFACMGKEWAFNKEEGAFSEGIRAFFEFHKDDICIF